MALHTVHSRIRFRARLELEPPGVQPIAAAKEVRAFTLFFFFSISAIQFLSCINPPCCDSGLRRSPMQLQLQDETKR